MHGWEILMTQGRLHPDGAVAGVSLCYLSSGQLLGSAQGPLSTEVMFALYRHHFCWASSQRKLLTAVGEEIMCAGVASKEEGPHGAKLLLLI